MGICVCIAIILNKFSILGSSADWVPVLYGSTTAAGHQCGHANYEQKRKKRSHTRTYTMTKDLTHREI